MIPQTETKPQLDRFDGGAKRIAQSVPGRPDGGSNWGSGDGGEGCGCIIVLITLGLLAILAWRMS
jgi:hypothetical protein